MKEIEELKSEIERIKERNKRVELDKAWETSWVRRILIAVLSYLVVGYTFAFFGMPMPWNSAFIPTIAYLISTTSLGIVKTWWIKRRDPETSSG